jgi:hypothetical protein
MKYINQKTSEMRLIGIPKHKSDNVHTRNIQQIFKKMDAKVQA